MAGLAVRQFDLGWTGAGIVTLVIALATALLMRASERRARAMGCASPAMMRYSRRMLVASMVYMAGFFVAVLAYKRFHVEGPALWLASLAPSVGTLGMIWAMTRLMTEETDEYLRFRLAKSALFATAVLLVLGTVWGFLEQFGLVPHVPSWAVLPIFAIALGFSSYVRWVRT